MDIFQEQTRHSKTNTLNRIIMSTRTDGFWKILTPEQAWHIHKHENIELYILHDDGSESLVFPDEDDVLQQAIDLNISIGIEHSDEEKLQNKSIL